MKKTLIILLFILQLSYSQNVQNEVGIKNTQIFYFDHFYDKQIGPINEGEDFFKPYLSYLKSDGTFEINSKLMDSFVLYDSYFVNTFWTPEGSATKPYNGRYDETELNNYLDNIFNKTRLTIIKNINANNVGVIGDNYTSSLAYNFSIPNNTNNINLKFRVKAPSFIETAIPVWGEIYIGIQFFNSTNQLLDEDDFGMSKHKYIGIETNDWEEENYNNITVPSETNYVKVFIMNYHLGIDSCISGDANNCIEYQNNPSEIFIDDVEIYINDSTNNLIDLNDSTFDTDPINSNWEFQKKYSQNLQFLFKHRDPILNNIKNAITQPTGESIDTIKIIPILPSINREYLENEEVLLKDKISNYIDSVVSKFNTWKMNNNTDNLELFGMYFVDENINDGRDAYLMSILSFIKGKLSDKNLKLLGSPYFDRHHPCDFNSTFNDTIFPLFDIVYQQPNAFFFDYNSENNLGKDQELLKLANNFASERNLNINIESRVFGKNNNADGSITEIYGRVNDYFDYGDKYGYINYSKMYYDDAGAHYLNSHSNNSKERIDYDNLYKFIKSSNKGVIINNRFELINKNNNSFYNWESGNVPYSIKNNVFSQNSCNREFNVILNNNDNFYSEIIPIQEDKKYEITFKAKEDETDGYSNSALVGVIFYDNQNNELLNLDSLNTNLSLTGYLGNYFICFDTKSNFKDFNLYFNAPPNAVKFKFYLKKWKNANIEFKNIKFIEQDNFEKSRLIYNNIYLNKLSLENKTLFGNHSLSLKYDESIISKEKISITPNVDYEIKISAKESLPIININTHNKALIAIETFDSNGLKITPHIDNFIYSAPLQKYFTYINDISNNSFINQTWKEFSFNTKFPNSVSSIRLHIHNWYYNNEVLIDNIELKISGSSPSVSNENQNLFIKENWSEKFPLTVSISKPIFYNDLIDVRNVSILEFSALLRDSHTYSKKNLLAIEFYDNNFDLLTNDDITPNNWNWSPYYKYWWQHYFDINSTECSENDNWAQNQWQWFGNDLSKTIDVPNRASYIRFSFHKLSDDNEEFLILHPTLEIKQFRENCKNSKTKKISKTKKNTISDNLLIYPNPSSSVLNIKCIKCQNNLYRIYNSNGILIRSDYLNENTKINISNLTSGVYFVRINDNGKSIVKKFIKKE